MTNPFIQLIAEGRLRCPEDLRATYRRFVMQMRPDAVGSDRLPRKFLELSDQYEEAKGYLAQSADNHDLPDGADIPNHRLAFYRQLHLVESLELPYALHPEGNQESLAAAKRMAIGELVQWRQDILELYTKADADHVAIKKEKPSGRYAKHAIALNLRTTIQNLVAFHITGQEVYARQSKQNLGAVMQELADQGWNSLHGLLTFMIEDLNNGAAVLERRPGTR
jgi:hypothetical protein